MRISAVRPYPVWIGARNQLLVKVETDEGVSGWGESGLSGREQAVVGALTHFERLVIGRDPMAIGALWQEMYRSQYFEGGRVLQAAISAVDIALHDIRGKALGVPVYELLGGRQRDSVPTFASATARDVEPSSTGKSRIRKSSVPAGSLEEPIRDETPAAYEALRRMTAVPFAIGEELASKWQFLPYIERDIHQFNRMDVCNLGGLTEAVKVAGWSEAHHVDLMPHDPLGPICTAASVHLGAAVPDFAWLETRVVTADDYLAEDDPELFTRRPRLTGASYRVDDAPGLGIEIDEDLLAGGDFRFWEAPHWKRRDGSVTNW